MRLEGFDFWHIQTADIGETPLWTIDVLCFFLLEKKSKLFDDFFLLALR